MLNVKSFLYIFVCVFHGEDGPDVNCSVSPLIVKEGTALEDVCTVTGNPTTSVQWLIDGKGINQSIPLTRDKAGTYTLKAKGHTSIEKNFTILVLCKYLGNFIVFCCFYKVL